MNSSFPFFSFHLVFDIFGCDFNQAMISANKTHVCIIFMDTSMQSFQSFLMRTQRQTDFDVFDECIEIDIWLQKEQQQQQRVAIIVVEVVGSSVWRGTIDMKRKKADGMIVTKIAVTYSTILYVDAIWMKSNERVGSCFFSFGTCFCVSVMSWRSRWHMPNDSIHLLFVIYSINRNIYIPVRREKVLNKSSPWFWYCMSLDSEYIRGNKSGKIGRR